MPEHLRKEMTVEADVSARHVDLVEVRPPWDHIESSGDAIFRG